MSTVGTLPEAKAKGKEEYRSVLYFASVAESQGKVPTVPTYSTYLQYLPTVREPQESLFHEAPLQSLWGNP